MRAMDAVDFLPGRLRDAYRPIVSDKVLEFLSVNDVRRVRERRTKDIESALDDLELQFCEPNSFDWNSSGAPGDAMDADFSGAGDYGNTPKEIEARNQLGIESSA